MAKGGSAEKTVREIRRKTRRKFSAEEKIRIVLESTYTPLAHPESTPPLREVNRDDDRSIRPGSAGKSHHRRDRRHGISEICPGPCNPEPKYRP